MINLDPTREQLALCHSIVRTLTDDSSPRVAIALWWTMRTLPHQGPGGPVYAHPISPEPATTEDHLAEGLRTAMRLGKDLGWWCPPKGHADPGILAMLVSAVFAQAEASVSRWTIHTWRGVRLDPSKGDTNWRPMETGDGHVYEFTSLPRPADPEEPALEAPPDVDQDRRDRAVVDVQTAVAEDSGQSRHGANQAVMDGDPPEIHTPSATPTPISRAFCRGMDRCRAGQPIPPEAETGDVEGRATRAGWLSQDQSEVPPPSGAEADEVSDAARERHARLAAMVSRGDDDGDPDEVDLRGYMTEADEPSPEGGCSGYIVAEDGTALADAVDAVLAGGGLAGVCRLHGREKLRQDCDVCMGRGVWEGIPDVPPVPPGAFIRPSDAREVAQLMEALPPDAAELAQALAGGRVVCDKPYGDGKHCGREPGHAGAHGKGKR